MDDLGIPIEECIRKDKSQFEKKGVENDIVELRYKHNQARLIDTLNKVLEQRRNIRIKHRANKLQD